MQLENGKLGTILRDKARPSQDLIPDAASRAELESGSLTKVSPRLANQGLLSVKNLSAAHCDEKWLKCFII